MKEYKVKFLTPVVEIEIDELTVEAESMEEAEKKALERFRVAYCYYSEWEYKWIIEELA